LTKSSAARKVSAVNAGCHSASSTRILGGVTTAGELFGSWNEAVIAAGLEPNPSRGREGEQHFTDDELLSEIIRVHRALGREPTERKMASRANYSLAPYRDRWGTLAKAREAAYRKFGRPDDAP